MKHITSWEADTQDVEEILTQAIEREQIAPTDTMYYGPSGDILVATTAEDAVDADCGDYDEGDTVAEYLDGKR